MSPPGVPYPGEVWLTAAPKDDPEAWTLQVIVLCDGRDGYRPFNPGEEVQTVSILPDPSEAGPEDRILPKEALGYEAAVSFELMATLPISALTACQGRLAPADFAALESGELPHGMTYIDKWDHRYLRHEEMAERISELQAGLWDKVVP
jgi:hypothetical protein